MTPTLPPTLPPNEWRAILDACNGLYSTPGLDLPATGSYIALEVSDADTIHDGAHAAKWSIAPARYAALVREIRSWSEDQAQAAAGVIAAFWGRCDPAEAERIRAAGGDPDAVPGEPGWVATP